MGASANSLGILAWWYYDISAYRSVLNDNLIWDRFPLYMTKLEHNI